MRSLNHATIARLALATTMISGALPAQAGGRTTVFRETVELIVGHGGRELTEKAARESAEQAVEIAVRQAVAPQSLAPILKELGPEAVKLEAKAPGVAHRVIASFGPDGARKIAAEVPAEDLPRLLAYAERADTPATRKALLEAYSKEGASLFTRIPPKLVFAGGLTAAVIYGTHRVTAPLAALGSQIGHDPTLARRTLDWAALIGGAAVLVVAGGFMWPRYRQRAPHMER